MEKLAEILIFYVHVPLGSLALLTGAIALIAKKGSTIHKTSGKLFFFSMLIAAIASFVISVLPEHENPFLLGIGLFSTYFLISGLRSLKLKQANFDPKWDRIVAFLIILIGFSMILYPILKSNSINIVLTVFGAVGIVFGFRDLKLLKNQERMKKGWLKLHLGKMTGGYIAAVSAFFVVNEILPGIWNWFVPGIVGSVFITYWMMLLDKGKK